MTWARVQQNDSGTVTGAAVASRTVTYASGPTQNNLLVAVAVASNDWTGLAMSSSGWTLLHDLSQGTATGQGDRMNYWYKIAGASESSTVTVTVTNTARLSLWIAEYSGVDASNPIDVSITNLMSSQGWYTGPATPAYKGGLRVAAFSDARDGWAAVSDSRAHGAAIYGAQFKHRSAAGDTTASRGQVWDLIPATTDDTTADMSLVTNSSNTASPCAALTVFRLSGAAAAGTRSSGAGTGTFVERVQGMATATSIATTPLVNTPAVGNLLVMILRHDSTNTETVTTIPSGWTQIGSYQDGNIGFQTHRFSAWYKIAGAGEPKTWTFGWTNSLLFHYSVLEYTLAGATVDATPTIEENFGPESSTTGGGYLWSGWVASQAAADEITLVVHSTVSTTNPTVTWGNSFTERTSIGGTGVSLKVADRFTAVAGTMDCASTFAAPGTSLSYSSGFIISFKGPASGNDHWAWAEDSADSWAA